MCLNKEDDTMEFLIKVAITIFLIAVCIALIPTGIGIVFAYPIGNLIAKVIWDEK